MQFGTNHLGHFELTRLLAPQLSRPSGARMVILSSDGHRDERRRPRRPELGSGATTTSSSPYGASKTANILHMVELDRRLRDSGVRSYAVHPGVVATSLARHMNRDDFDSLQPCGNRRIRARRKSTFAGTSRCPNRARPLRCGLATSTELADVGSVYLADCAIRDDVAPYALDEARAAGAVGPVGDTVRRGSAAVNRIDRRKVGGPRPNSAARHSTCSCCRGFRPPSSRTSGAARRRRRIAHSSTTSPPGRT